MSFCGYPADVYVLEESGYSTFERYRILRPIRLVTVEAFSCCYTPTVVGEFGIQLSTHTCVLTPLPMERELNEDGVDLQTRKPIRRNLFGGEGESNDEEAQTWVHKERAVTGEEEIFGKRPTVSETDESSNDGPMKKRDNIARQHAIASQLCEPSKAMAPTASVAVANPQKSVDDERRPTAEKISEKDKWEAYIRAAHVGPEPVLGLGDIIYPFKGLFDESGPLVKAPREGDLGPKRVRQRDRPKTGKSPKTYLVCPSSSVMALLARKNSKKIQDSLVGEKPLAIA
ncbi:unnamed protein product [Arabis nemorensis]|uniref:Uncharacterized protein n=1 Tax=Arabis nemorensis TaxID=586526 RepID=A0A565AZ84_9BRAS|nr:unnamed protein product [Arabis nemorensis]